jgi:fumarate reductase (CoM/CoB) subunit A
VSHGRDRPAVREHDTDVLVIGGGLAALRAALAASEEGGARVAIAVKGKLGRSGGSATTTGGYAAVLSELETGDDLEVHYEDTLRGGAYIADPNLVRVMTDEAPARLRELEEMGGRFLRREGRLHLAPGGDHSFARTAVPETHVGTDFTVPMTARALDAGVESLESTMAVELLRDGGRVVGAIGLDLKRQQLVVIHAGAVVLATGGAGRLFSISSNPNDVTGDGFALAARAGAELRDMEFIQFYPWRCIDPFKNTRVAIQPSTFVNGGRLYNRIGERFMLQYEPERAEGTTRDVAARAIFEQIRNGLDVRGGVRLDVSTLSEEVWQRTNPRAARLLERDGIDYRTYEFIVAPEAHYFMGGVRIDEHGASSVPGLYAAGEVAGGIQGANRIGNNALPETQVFGRRAGLAAAALAGRAADPSADGTADAGVDGGDEAPLGGWQARLTQLGQAPSAAAQLEELRTTLQRQMWASLGIIRTEEGMREGLATIRETRARLGSIQPSGAIELRDQVEIDFLCDVGELCLVPAIVRTESRGAHYRDDHPERQDPEWQVALVLRRMPGGEIEHRVVPAERAPVGGGTA